MIIVSLVILKYFLRSDTSSVVLLSSCFIRISVKPEAICTAFSDSLAISILVN